MTTTSGGSSGRFHVGYDERSERFKAYAHKPDRDVWTLVEESYSLEELLQKCKNRGLTVFDGLDQAAIDLIHHWLVVDRPAIQFVESLWEGSGSASKKGPMGFRPTLEEIADDE